MFAPLVSVAMICYNHRPYLSQALNSVLAQSCDFNYEIIISDDCSPDGTAEVIRDFANCHSSIVQIDPPCNIGMHANFNRVWQRCRGKYIAILEGDDYWTDTDKLARQVEMMEARPDITACGHAVTSVLPDGTAGPMLPVNHASAPKHADTVALLKHGNILPTCSSLYRAGLVPRLPKWISRTGFVDYALLLLQSLHGRVAYMPVPMACYRVHAGGAWSTAGAAAQITREFKALRIMLAEERGLPCNVRAALRARIRMLGDAIRDEAYEARRRGDHASAWRLHRTLFEQRVDAKDYYFAMKSLATTMRSVAG